MDSNLPQKYNNGIFSKIKRFFSGLFGNLKENTSIESTKIKENESQNTNVKEENTVKNSIDIMREQNVKNREKEDLLLQIEKNPDLINDWPVEKLKKLEAIYDKKIEEYDKEIAKLNKNIA